MYISSSIKNIILLLKSPCYQIAYRSKKKSISIAFFIFLLILTTPSNNLTAQECYSTIDWLNFIDVPSYLHKTKWGIIYPVYYVNNPVNQKILKEGKTIQYDDDTKAWFFIICLNFDWKFRERIFFGILPVGTLGISPGGIMQMDIETWLKMKYYPLKGEDSFFRLAVKVPLHQPENFENQVDIDLSVFFSKSFSGFVPEVLLGYRYRFKTHRKPDIYYQKYGAPGNEFHYRAGFNIQRRESTRASLFLMGYLGQNMIEYSYNDYFGESKTIYQGSYKLSIGVQISQFFKAVGILRKDTWVNMTVFKGISWRNELGGWGFVLGFGI